MALTRLATRGDLSQLRWARWQSARSFDAHSLSAYGGPRAVPDRAGWSGSAGPTPPPTRIVARR